MKSTLSTFFLCYIMITFASCSSDPILPTGGNGVGVTPTNLTERIIIDTAYGSDPKQKMDIYLPAGRNGSTKVIIMIHGGAWVGGDKVDFNYYKNLLRVAWPEAAIVNINYRLANQVNVHHTEITNDIKACVALIKNAKSNFVISDTFAMLGASAGGQLAMLYTYAENQGNNVKVVGSIFGPTVLNDWSWYSSFNIFLGVTPSQFLSAYVCTPWNGAAITPQYEAVSPYTRVNATSKPTILFHGTADVVVPVYQAQWMKAKLDNLGVINQYHEYPFEQHGFINPSNDYDCINKTVAFFKQQLR